MEAWQIVVIVISSAVLAGLIAFIIFCFGISKMMARKMCMPKHFRTKEEKEAELAALGKIDGVDEYTRTPIEFKLSDGYIIHGDYSLNNPKKFVICMHGHVSCREGSVKYAYAFYRLGYSLLFYDHRSHGDNERGKITLGYQEHKDALEIIGQLKEKFGQDIEIGLFGCSMGGATALLCVGKSDDIKFVVSDCAFAAMKNLVKGFIKIHFAPYFPILQITEYYLKKNYGVCYADSCPKDNLKNNTKTPILFIQGTKDKTVFPYNAQELFDSDNGPKQLEYFEGAPHCGGVSTDKKKYYKVIEDFVKQYGGR